jgi:hypothetical protein
MLSHVRTLIYLDFQNCYLIVQMHSEHRVRIIISKRHTSQRSWKSCVIWIVIQCWRIFHHIRLYRLPGYQQQLLGTVDRSLKARGAILKTKCRLSILKHCLKSYILCPPPITLSSMGRPHNIANHALVFMADHLHRKWKQLVAYINHVSIKAAMILQFLISSGHPSVCWTAGCYHWLWHGCQQYQDLDVDECLPKGNNPSHFIIKKLQFPEVHPQQIPEVGCALEV